MPTYNWEEFLAQWSDSILASQAYRQALPPEVKATGWLGYPGATEAQLAQAEARLKIALPPSYREFLKVSNGWRVATSFVDRLLSTEEIDWFAAKHQNWIDVWTSAYRHFGKPDPIADDAYFVYGEGQDPNLIREEYLQTALAISEGGEAIYLLNSQVVNADGEWEAWFFESELGTRRYRSFWEMMQAEYRVLSLLKEDEERRFPAADTAQMVATKLPELIEELQRKAQQYVLIGKQTTPDPSMASYHEGILEGLQFAVARVREIQARTQHSRQLRKQLSALADELERKWQEATRTAKQASRHDQTLPRAMNNLLNHLRPLAVSEGYRQAMGIIRWFLNEQEP